MFFCYTAVCFTFLFPGKLAEQRNCVPVTRLLTLDSVSQHTQSNRQGIKALHQGGRQGVAKAPCGTTDTPEKEVVTCGPAVFLFCHAFAENFNRLY